MADGSLLQRLGSWLSRRAALPAPAGTQSPPLLSAYDQPGWLSGWPSMEAENERGIRPLRVYGKTRWNPVDADEALRAAEQGVLQPVAQFLDAMRRDGIISGILNTRTSGMLRCPVKFNGDPWLVEQLRGRNPVYDSSGVQTDAGTPGVFWDMFPESEQASILFDGIMAGVGIGELVPRKGKAPRLRHLPLQFLRYQFQSDFYWYQSGSGVPWAITVDTDEPVVANYPDLPVPVSQGGDERGRFVLFTPYGRERPWMKGLWWPCSLPFITRQNVVFDGLRWQMNLADPLKVIEAQDGADERHRMWLFNFVTSLWRRAAGLVTPPKYKASLVESNGRGYEVYQQSNEQAATDLQITLAGSKQIVSGGSAFANMSIQRDISADLTGKIAEAWSTTLHEQAIRPWVAGLGQDRSRAPWARWDVRAPEQREADARAIGKLAEAVQKYDAMLVPRRRLVDLDAMLEEFGQSVPTMALPPGTPVAPAVDSEPAASDEASETEADAEDEAEGQSPVRHLRRVA